MISNSDTHFVLGLCLAIFFFLAIKRESRKCVQLTGTFSIFCISFWFLYWQCAFSHIAWVIAAYIFPFTLSILLLFIFSVQRTAQVKLSHIFEPLKAIIFAICSFCCLIIASAIPLGDFNISAQQHRRGPFYVVLTKRRGSTFRLGISKRRGPFKKHLSVLYSKFHNFSFC